MERRTKLEILNLILVAAKEQTFPSEERIAASEVGRKALTIYNKLRVRLITEFPWPFALKRVPLLLSPERPISTWTYYYYLPPNFGHDWDVYANQPNYQYPSSYDFSVYRGYFDTVYGESEATLEAGFVASNMTDLKMLYTRSDIQEHEFTTQYIRALEYEGALELMYQRNTNPAKLALLEKRMEKKISDAKRLQSISLPVRRKLGPTQMYARAVRGV